ncbi:MAG: class I SAM-dependent methyltransferase [Candidatus Scalindua sp.]
MLRTAISDLKRWLWKLVLGGGSCKLFSEKSINCTFIDFNWKAVLAQKRLSPGLNILCADGTKLPFKPKSFDKVLARNVIHNFPAHNLRTDFYRESARTIKNNGELIFSLVPNRIGMFFDVKHYIDPKLRHRLRKTHDIFWPLSIRKMKEELHGLGFKLVHIRKTPEPMIEKVYYRFRQLARRFFVPLFYNHPIIYNFVDIKFKKFR